MLGDGIRRNIATVSKEERDRLRDAIIALQTSNHYPATTGDPRSEVPPGGVSYWFKQDEIHANTHVHSCPAFVPWHRELMNRFEDLIRGVDPQLSLHYWDWTVDPRALTDIDGKPLNLFTSDFFGSPSGNYPGEPMQADVGPPWRPNGFYVPNADPYRSDIENDPGHDNPYDPPQDLPYAVGGGSLVADDSAALNATSFKAFHDAINISHGTAHGYIGGILGDPHTAFRSPVAFLLHSNLDRIWAMWQRTSGHPQRLDPAHVYDYTAGEWPQDPEKGVGDLAVSDLPWWGFRSPLMPWAGPGAQTPSTGVVNNVNPVRPWAPPENEQVYKDSRDPSVVIPRSYDTAVHAMYIIVNRDTFSSAEVTAMGTPATFPAAFYVVCDGFEPQELGVTTAGPPLPQPPAASLPTFTYGGAGSLQAVNPTAFYEDPSGAIDMPQRIMIQYDLKFTGTGDFPSATGGENLFKLQTSLTYKVDTGTGGTVVNQTVAAPIELALVNQPNPYMDKINSALSPPNPYWLSIDTRVFQVKGPGGGQPAGSLLIGPTTVTQGDMDTDANAPFTFITNVMSALRASPSQFDNTTLFPTGETASQLELSQKAGAGNAQRVYNYALARVRYLAPSGGAGVPAAGVGAFFRVFSTAVSALDYDATSETGNGNYRRHVISNATAMNPASAVPLLGIENDSVGNPETASIPFFATARVDPSTTSMRNQPVDTPNIQTINNTGSENVQFFGAWLDINLAPGDPHFVKLPLNPTGITNWPDGPYSGSASNSIQQLMLNTHHCLVAEVFFWPPNTTTDPIPHDATPASSNRLAQRNLVLVRSGNPGFPATHRVQTTFIVKPSVIPIDSRGNAAAGVAKRFQPEPDELIIRWDNVPRNSEANIYMPEIDADEILSLSALRQHPPVLAKVDAHTLTCRLSDVTFIPLPMNRKGTIAGLMSVTLPDGVRAGQVYRFSVEQYSGSARKTLGAFQMTIPVNADDELLPEEIRKLSIMRYIQLGIPASSRWSAIFARYIEQIAARVRGFGGDPNAIQPSPDGGEGAEVPPEKDHCIKWKILFWLMALVALLFFLLWLFK